MYNEAVFRGLDYALEQARQRGLKVHRLSMSDFGASGGHTWLSLPTPTHVEMCAVSPQPTIVAKP